MNALAPVPSGARQLPTRIPRPSRLDQEFLPAALEILETPPSPVGIVLLWIICLLAVGALTWSYFGRIDVIAVAQGKIQPSGRVKIIQPVEAGRIIAVNVQNGQRVQQGEDLIGLESGEADADVNELKAHLDGYRGEVDRRRAALRASKTRQTNPDVVWDADIPEAVKARETLVLEGDLNQLAAKVSELQAQRRQKLLERDQFTATGAALDALVSTLQERVEMRAILHKSGSGSKADLIDALEKSQEQKASLATARGQAAETEAAADVLNKSIDDSYSTFFAENRQKLAEAERQIDEAQQRLAKARVRQHRMVLKSPISGTVSALSVTTMGQVVGAGEEIMRIVPDGIEMEIECYIPNRDIGFVHLGQDAVIKVESLPFTRYGTVQAKLTRIASDAIPEPEAAQAEGNPNKSFSDKGFAGAQRTQNLVFSATLHPEVTSIVADGATVPLSAGMAVTVEIKTGSRRILEYIFSPLVETASEALKER